MKLLLMVYLIVCLVYSAVKFCLMPIVCDTVLRLHWLCSQVYYTLLRSVIMNLNM